MRVLAYTSPARGHFYPLVPILEELRRRGHEPHVRTLASEVETAERLGIEAAPIAAEVEAIEHDDFGARTPLGAQQRALDVFMRRAGQELRDVKATIAEVRPDLLLVDVNSWGAAAVAEASGLQWATWAPYPLPLPSRDAPPWGPGFAPADGAAGRLRDRVLGRVLTRRFDSIVLDRLNALRASLGLPALGHAADMLVRPGRVLYMTAEPFEYPRSDWPGNVRLIGPTNWSPPAEPPAWLDEGDAPLVLVTLSTEFQDDGRLATTALAALADEPVRVVVTTAAVDPAGFDPPANARVERFVPHAPVLERAACVVCHGGMGITQKALAAGVPVCVVPFGRDQLEVARRVEVSGAGARLPAQRLGEERLRTAVRDAMSRRAGAERVAAAFTAAGGAVAAADAIEEIAPQAAAVSGAGS